MTAGDIPGEEQFKALEEIWSDSRNKIYRAIESRFPPGGSIERSRLEDVGNWAIKIISEIVKPIESDQTYRWLINNSASTSLFGKYPIEPIEDWLGYVEYFAQKVGAEEWNAVHPELNKLDHEYTGLCGFYYLTALAYGLPVRLKFFKILKDYYYPANGALQMSKTEAAKAAEHLSDYKRVIRFVEKMPNNLVGGIMPLALLRDKTINHFEARIDKAIRGLDEYKKWNNTTSHLKEKILAQRIMRINILRLGAPAISAIDDFLRLPGIRHAFDTRTLNRIAKEVREAIQEEEGDAYRRTALLRWANVYD